MALQYIQEEKWAAQILAFLETMTVASRICNTNLVRLEGSDKWHIITPTDVSTFDVNDGADITYSAQTDTDTEVTKNFDKGFALLIKDTDVMQASSGWEQKFAENGAYQLAAALDTAVLANHASAGSNSFATGSTSWQFTINTCLEVPRFLASIRKALRDNAVDAMGKPYVVGPTGFGEAIDTYVAGRESALGDQVLLAGGQRTFDLNGIQIYISNNCDTAASVTHGLAGIQGYGYALGKYMTPKMIELVGRAESRYGDLIRGRLAAGHKVYKSAGLIDVNFNETVVSTT